MRKVILRMKEQRKYEVIKKLVETNGNRKRAAVELDLSLRPINRLIAGYIAYGKEKIKKGWYKIETIIIRVCPSNSTKK